MESIIRAIEIYPDRVRLLDQRKLPLVEEYVECRTYQEVAEAIRTMVVRRVPLAWLLQAGLPWGQHLQSGSPRKSRRSSKRFALPWRRRALRR